MATLQDILGGGLPAGLLSPEQEAAVEARARNAGLLNLGFALLQSSQGQVGQPRPTLGRVISQAGPVGVQAYQQSFEKSLNDLLKGLQIRSMVSEMGAPKYMTIKTPAGGEQLIQIPKGGGAPAPVQIPGLDMTSKPIDFDAPTQAFISLKFGKPFNELTAEQKLEVSQFMNAPNDEKITSLRIEAEKQKFETGQTVTIPRGRSEFLIPAPTVAPPAAPAVAPPTPTVAPPTPAITPPAAKPTSAEVTETDISKLRVPLSLVSRTMTEKETPLIESSAISPKQKSQLMEARPQTQSSVEYVVNTNRAMRNTIQQILSSPGFNDAFGFGGQTLSKISGSPAADVLGDLEKLGGSLFVEAITALRNASKNGAGVGNATEKEGEKLERSKAAIQQFRSPEAARKELERLNKLLEEAEANVLNAYERTYGKGSFRFSPLETPEARGKRPPLQNIFGVPQ